MKLNHIAIPYLAALAFIVGAIINGDGIAWYHTLTLPVWNPSPAVIAVIWAFIYTLAAWSLMMVWNMAERHPQFRSIIGGFAGVTLINLVWSILFFHFHMLLAAAITAFVLGLVVLILMVAIYPRSKKAAHLLIPYTLWVFFAAYLNYLVFTLNP